MAIVLGEPVAPVVLVLLTRERGLGVGAGGLLLLAPHLLHLLLVQHRLFALA